ncbi:MAG: nicotinamidase [Candidatus Brocadia sp.]|uniref:Isochorismatase hydrolase n=1 Tax=Candidatus Brocadia fulgida TaxID=380242 RepID=A0A0M2URR2_9BACT|nr:MAG: isochorismatase hydrolase [Candidatus Brocadia fulgida]MBV6466135.1 Enterobactin synthase component B [Anaerolineales bacterium]MCC6324154.1 cysteine hydrolase [Candidatus Brocadia sp.]MCE7912840.1 cysteine hydrolase [Candidatus Brocadia sp. AMX3]MDG5998140.1 cysteine hydrolase [Candidatus Brocadia sp.]
MKKGKSHDKVRYAFLVCDMLNDFVKEGAALEVPRARTIIGNMKKELKKARKNRIPVIYCCDAHKNSDPEFNLWPRHAVRGTDGALVIEQLRPQKRDYRVQKTSYSCFYKTSLDRILKKLGITHVIITGVVTNICVLYTAADAYMRGYKIVVPDHCVAALTIREHQFALQQMKRIFHANVISVL